MRYVLTSQNYDETGELIDKGDIEGLHACIDNVSPSAYRDLYLEVSEGQWLKIEATENTTLSWESPGYR